LYLQVAGGRVIGTSPSPDHPVARGRLCVKGWHAHEVATSPGRLTRPLIRRDAALEPTSWSDALDLVAGRLLSLKAEHGAAAVGVLGSARCTNEDNFLLSKLARVGLGTNNVDTTARLEALPGLFDLPQYRHLTRPGAGIAALDEADLIILWRTDPVQDHPAAAARIVRAARRGVPIVEVAWLSGQMGNAAALKLAPRPGSDAWLAGGLLHIALQQAASLSPEWECLAASFSDLTPDRAEAATGVPAGLIAEAGRMLGAAVRPLIVYTRALTLQSEAADVLAGLSALRHNNHGSGEGWPRLLWLSRYSNLQGARDMGVVPYFLPGYQPLADQRARAKFGEAWGAPIPTEGGLSGWEMLGAVRALFVMGDDPLGALPDPAGARRALGALDLLVVVDTVLSPTTEAAHVVLPGASFAEKDGTFTSSEHRLQRLRAAVSPPGEARPEWQIICELSRRLGRPMEYASAADIMAEVASLAPPYTGITYQALDDSPGGLFVPPQATTGEEAGETAARAELSLPAEQAPAPETDDGFPFILALDHGLRSWGSEPIVLGSVCLRRELAPGRAPRTAQLEISAADARQSGFRDGQQVVVRSRVGEMRGALHLSESLRPGLLLLPYSAREAAAAVMPPSLHGETGVPLLLPCAVSIHQVQ
jgi:predicted molibdopterin-dependent oxidoreductase YjgC